MDYKETLHMPKTAFEMRGNLTKKSLISRSAGKMKNCMKRC